MIVVDASLVAKLFLDEPGSSDAIDFFTRRTGQLAGPDILLVEVTSALVRRANARTADPEEVSTSLADWFEIWTRAEIVPHRITPDLTNDAAAFAMALGHPLADCLYLALAVRLGCDLATSDVRFRDRAVARYPQVRLLSELVP